MNSRLPVYTITLSLQMTVEAVLWGRNIPATEASQHGEGSIGRWCLERTPWHRTLLLSLVPAYHGSTALESVFMSSSNLATLCTADMWQCEGNKILAAEVGFSNNMSTWNFSTMLDVYSKYWDLDRPVLLEKSPNQLLHVKAMREGLLRVQMPLRMQHHGVRALTLKYVMMWRPLCLWTLSTKSIASLTKTPRAWILRELELYETMVEAHRYLSSVGQEPLVINFADLLWNPRATKARIESFVPCLGDLDFEKEIELGKTVFLGNHWKLSGAVHSFAREHDPKSCCGYLMNPNGTGGACSGASVMEFQTERDGIFRGNVLAFLHQDEKERIGKALNFLQVQSDSVVASG